MPSFAALEARDRARPDPGSRIHTSTAAATASDPRRSIARLTFAISARLRHRGEDPLLHAGAREIVRAARSRSTSPARRSWASWRPCSSPLVFLYWASSVEALPAALKRVKRRYRCRSSGRSFGVVPRREDEDRSLLGRELPSAALNESPREGRPYGRTAEPDPLRHASNDCGDSARAASSARRIAMPTIHVETFEPVEPRAGSSAARKTC
jgi:hypothetical protein